MTLNKSKRSAEVTPAACVCRVQQKVFSIRQILSLASCPRICSINVINYYLFAWGRCRKTVFFSVSCSACNLSFTERFLWSQCWKYAVAKAWLRPCPTAQPKTLLCIINCLSEGHKNPQILVWKMGLGLHSHSCFSCVLKQQASS